MRSGLPATATIWERATTSWYACAFMFLWAAAEAVVWPIVPDFLLGPLVVGNRRRTKWFWLASVSGMTVGGSAGYLLACRDPSRARDMLQSIPLTSAEHVDVVRRRLKRRGVRAFLVQPYSGIPMKVWAAAAAAEQISPGQAIPTFVFARAIRMALIAWSVAIMPTKLRTLLNAHFVGSWALYMLVFFTAWRRTLRKARYD